MKVLIHFNVHRDKKLFEAEQLKRHIIAACEDCAINYVEKHEKNVSIANFISLNQSSTNLIRFYVERSVPTLLWMFYANTDADAEIIKTRKNGEKYIPKSRLALINMMDAIIVPSNEAKLYLWKLKVRIPVFIARNGVKEDYYNNLKKIGKEPFVRYFRIDEKQKYVVSVVPINKRREKLQLLNKLAKSVPNHNFYVFVSAKNTVFSKMKLRRLDRYTARNLIVSPIVREDVYRSGLYGASYFLDSGDDKFGLMSLVEVIAAKTPVIIEEKAAFLDILQKESAYFRVGYEEIRDVLLSNADSNDKIAAAIRYTTKNTRANFTNAVCELFTKIYHR
ncbi:MAG TPA: hypothetical protein VFD05_03375 [Bacilli bacterium]|nr:hypothetical protein [Bacilli bacterium]